MITDMGHPLYDDIPPPRPWDPTRPVPHPPPAPYRPAPDDTVEYARIPPLTDSGVHRLMVGTVVRVHLSQGPPVEVGLLTIRNVATWEDLVYMISEGRTLDVLGPPVRQVIAGWCIMRVEVVDQAEQR
jgi:hypothetical protein